MTWMEEQFGLTGKCALVTGGGRGIGLGITKALAKVGAKVLIIGSSGASEEAAQELVKEGLSAQFLRYDIAQLDGLEAMFGRAIEILSQVDILVNNAAIQRRYDAEDFPIEEYQRVIDINLSAAFRLCQVAGRHMKQLGRGKIINLASMNSYFGGYRVAAYAASKGGVMQMTKAFANEWAKYGINVNAIAPGGFKTDMTRALWDDPATDRQAMLRTPAGRWGTEADIGGTAVFLASAASDYLSGVTIPVDGGYLVR